MADFALWATACEGAFRPAGTLETAYSNNRRNAIENMIDAHSVAACARELMTDRAQWTGSASDLLQHRRGAEPSGWRFLTGRRPERRPRRSGRLPGSPWMVASTEHAVAVAPSDEDVY
jgi:hypothetical protein